jgi:uncharacterized membrane protein
MKEKTSRSVWKTVSWRIIATMDTVIISYLITDSLAFAAAIGGIEVVTKIFLYYFHERAWNNISFGKV